MTTASLHAASPAALSLDDALDRVEDLQEQLRQREEQIAKTQDDQAKTKESIIAAELTTEDAFVRRARPSVVYAGLLFIFLNHVLFPLIFKTTGYALTAHDIAAFILPDEFWWAWGGLVGTWSIGRTFEKNGASNRLTRMITGSAAAQQASTRNAPSDGAVG